MAGTIYENNSVSIEAINLDAWETSIVVNGKNLIVISSSEEESFKREISAILDRYRI